MRHPHEDEEQHYSSQGEYLSMAVAEYAREHGRLNPEAPWVLSPFDTWEQNPAYQGPPAPHPDEEEADYRQMETEVFSLREPPYIGDCDCARQAAAKARAAGLEAYCGLPSGDPDEIPF